MKRKFSDTLKYLLTGSFSVVFAACYGTPVSLETPKVIKASDKNSEPIKGLKVTVYENSSNIGNGFTDDEGIFEIPIEQIDKNTYKVSIEDIDGIENGGEFLSKEADITESSFIELTLDKKE